MKTNLTCKNCNSKKMFDLSDYVEQKKLVKFCNRKLITERASDDYSEGYKHAIREVKAIFCKGAKEKGPLFDKLKDIEI